MKSAEDTPIMTPNTELKLSFWDIYLWAQIERERKKQETNVLHLAYLFASPLIMKWGQKSEKGVKAVMKINFKREFDSILNSLDNTNWSVKYWKLLASIDNFSPILLQTPKILHFSGHGLRNNKEDLGVQEAIVR